MPHDCAIGLKQNYLVWLESRRTAAGQLPRFIDDPVYPWWSTIATEFQFNYFQFELTHLNYRINASLFPLLAQIAHDINIGLALPNDQAGFEQRYHRQLESLPSFVALSWQHHHANRWLITIPSSWTCPSLPQWEQQMQEQSTQAVTKAKLLKSTANDKDVPQIAGEWPCDIHFSALMLKS